MAMGEQRDGAIVVSLARVLVNQFVQFGTRRHRVQQQNEGDQQSGERRLAVRFEMTISELQIVCNIIKRFPGASLFNLKTAILIEGQTPTSAAPKTPAESPSWCFTIGVSSSSVKTYFFTAATPSV